MEISKSILINAPIARVWEILANDYADVGSWTAAINNSQAIDGDRLPGAPTYGRVCETPDGVFKERITEYDEDRHVLAYLVEEGLPFFVRQGGNTWSLSSVNGGKQTRVQMEMTFLMPWLMEKMMGPILRKQMSRAAHIFTDDLKVYAESGAVSSRKRGVA
ncbi:MAG: SRPBCC family protein [Myxococcota bacterium]